MAICWLKSSTRPVSRSSLNPYLLNGSIQLGALFPQIRVGTRLRIQHAETSQEENYYVEHVGHSWSASSGGRTTLGVSRGWIGGDAAYLNVLRQVAGRYTTVTTRYGQSGTVATMGNFTAFTDRRPPP